MQKQKNLIPIFIGLMASLLIYAMDSTVFSTAMKKIVQDIGGGTWYSWPFTSYMLCSTVIIPIAGAISDSLGHKPVFLTGILGFLLGSALCGISQNMVQLIVFRAVQGIGGGIIVSGVFTLVADLFPPAERGKYTGIVSSMYGLANIIGPLAGGIIADRLTWRWIFYLNLPVGLTAFFLLCFKLPRFLPENKKKADRAGMTLLVLALTPLLLALSLAGNLFAWNSAPILLMLFGSAIMLVLLGITQRRAENPVLPPKYFSDRRISMSLAVSFLNQIVMIGTVIYLPYFEQYVLKMSATASGIVLAPMMVSLVLAGNLTGLLISKTGKCGVWSVTGFVISAIGIALMSAMNENTSSLSLITFAVLVGIGAGMNMPVGNVNAQNSVPKSRIGSVTSAVTFARNVGTAGGSALFGAVLTLARNSGPADLSALRTVFRSGIPVAALGILCALLLRDASPEPQSAEQQEALADCDKANAQ